MTCQNLSNYYIKFGKKQELNFDARETGVILVPPKNTKLYVQFLNEQGQMLASNSITYAAKVVGKVRLVNGSPVELDLHVIQL